MSATRLPGAPGILAGDPRPGVLYGIGVGPGDPGLVTVRAAGLLGRLDVVAVPRSVRAGHGIAAHAIAPYVDPGRLVELVSEMPADNRAVRRGWRDRVAPLVAALDAGRTTGFATDGDPGLYSTFTHVAEAVAAARPSTRVTIVAGVPAMCAAAAADTSPLASGADRLAVLPASRVGDAELCAALRTADTVVLLKAGAALERIRALIAGPARGWGVEYARRVGLPGEERAATLDGLAEPADYMSLVVLRRPREGGG